MEEAYCTLLSLPGSEPSGQLLRPWRMRSQLFASLIRVWGWQRQHIRAKHFRAQAAESIRKNQARPICLTNLVGFCTAMHWSVFGGHCGICRSLYTLAPDPSFLCSLPPSSRGSLCGSQRYSGACQAVARSCCAAWLTWSCRYSKSPSGQPSRMHLTVLHEHLPGPAVPAPPCCSS